MGNSESRHDSDAWASILRATHAACARADTELGRPEILTELAGYRARVAREVRNAVATTFPSESVGEILLRAEVWDGMVADGFVDEADVRATGDASRGYAHQWHAPCGIWTASRLIREAEEAGKAIDGRMDDEPEDIWLRILDDGQSFNAVFAGWMPFLAAMSRAVERDGEWSKEKDSQAAARFLAPVVAEELRAAHPDVMEVVDRAHWAILDTIAEPPSGLRLKLANRVLDGLRKLEGAPAIFRGADTATLISIVELHGLVQDSMSDVCI